ncbi:MAG: hypothetical protein WBX77_18770, partial [Pseudolabrys sp.]
EWMHRHSADNYNIVVDFYPPSPLIKTALNVRFGSKADMCSAQAHVCFVPKADIAPDLFDHFVCSQQKRLR